MNKKMTVALLAAVLLACFFLGLYSHRQRAEKEQVQRLDTQSERLVRFHSPTLGPAAARVTLVEFFDPACETCRAFYPIVKDILNRYPEDVRLVLRYAPLHDGSAQVITLLEAARRQGRFQPVLESLLEAQPRWADHRRPDLDLAVQTAQAAGLDIEQARAFIQSAEAGAVIGQDVQDMQALGVNKTPTFFVNGRPLPSFGADQLNELVAEEVARARR